MLRQAQELPPLACGPLKAPLLRQGPVPIEVSIGWLPRRKGKVQEALGESGEGCWSPRRRGVVVVGEQIEMQMPRP